MEKNQAKCQDSDSYLTHSIKGVTKIENSQFLILYSVLDRRFGIPENRSDFVEHSTEEVFRLDETQFEKCLSNIKTSGEVIAKMRYPIVLGGRFLPIGAVYGDPHLETFADKSLFSNEVGDFILAYFQPEFLSSCYRELPI